jgi:hypothetical protein
VKKLWALLWVLVASAAAAATTNGLPWIKDDYSKALAVAKQRNVPIFVECWAPW